ncbi:nucleotide exchange factor GrpE [Actinomycetospora sp. CA-084318]|uniref:nucleotide exchange factor GrpE n=1 Tax=Actinomycetospora sp. CA-084318 TaxID=3239892 RepID=UPI003D99F187
MQDPTDVREDVSVEDHQEEFGAGSDGPGGNPVASTEGVEVPDAAVGGTPTSADGAAETADGVAADPELTRLRTDLEERTEDLKRLSAEYANYRRRVERDREATVNGAKAQVAGELLTVLDDVERARQHGDLTGAFKVVADRLTETLNRSGLAGFGEVGDAFDPSVHEAVASATSAEVEGPTVTTVMRRGYRFGEKVLRPAMVEVTDHDPDAVTADSGTGGSGSA